MAPRDPFLWLSATVRTLQKKVKLLEQQQGEVFILPEAEELVPKTKLCLNDLVPTVAVADCNDATRSRILSSDVFAYEESTQATSKRKMPRDDDGEQYECGDVVTHGIDSDDNEHDAARNDDTRTEVLSTDVFDNHASFLSTEICDIPSIEDFDAATKADYFESIEALEAQLEFKFKDLESGVDALRWERCSADLATSVERMEETFFEHKLYVLRDLAAKECSDHERIVDKLEEYLNDDAGRWPNHNFNIWLLGRGSELFGETEAEGWL